MAACKINKRYVSCNASKNAQVQGTNDCSIISKHSSATKGYVDDNYLKAFVSKPQQRSPLINRGYYIRFKAISAAFSSWWKTVLSTSFDKFQIISLGAGFDTSYFRLKANQMFLPGSRYIEVDFPEVMSRKLSCIMSDSDLSNLIDLSDINSAVKNSQIIFWSSDYILLGVDLNSVHDLQDMLNAIGINYMLPTMFLSECAVTYMDGEKSSLLIKWAKAMFPNSAFVTYEQVYPSDGFGHVMQNHFISIGSPLKSLLVYPDIETQRNRYLYEGWKSSLVIGVNDFYASLPTEEKSRIQQIELFDEYEMWHQKCSHYVLICASQGEVACIDNFLRLPGILHTPSQVYGGTVYWENSSASCLFERYGHQIALLSCNSIIVSGGFGHVKEKHQRLGGLILADSTLASVIEVDLLDPKNTLGKRMHHTLTLLSDDRLVVFGGRTSPARAYGNAIILSPTKRFTKKTGSPSDTETKFICRTECEDVVQCEQRTFVDFQLKDNSLGSCTEGLANQGVHSQYTCEQIHLEGSNICCRWRHSTNSIVHEGVENIVIFGGCCVNQKVLNDCYIVNMKTWVCLQVPLTPETPSPRHSHSSSVYKSHHIVVSGGLTADECVLNTVHVLDINTQKWIQLPVVGLIPRYSHTSHVWKDNLILIGGINTMADYPPGISAISLTTFQVKEFKLPGQDPEFPILLNNHTSCLKDEKIVIIGGGGNCFSFGTHFNQKILYIDVNQFFCT